METNNSCWFHIAGITISINADLPITDSTFSAKLRNFLVHELGTDRVSLSHHFYIPTISTVFAKPIYQNPPWSIYRCGNDWVYLGINPDSQNVDFHQVVYFNQDHSIGNVYSSYGDVFQAGNLNTITLFPTDQILLARLLADRQGCIFHSAGMIMDGQGLLFVGHSEAGKSTIVTQLQSYGEILCDDRMIVRRWPEGFKVHGTWSHGDIPIVSPHSALLRAICLLEQAPYNRLIPLDDKKEVVLKLPFYVIKPLVTKDWWEKTLDLIGQIAREVPVYRLQFDKSGRIIDVLKSLLII